MSTRCSLEGRELHFPGRLLRKAPTSPLELLSLSPSQPGQEATARTGAALPQETSPRARRRDHHTGQALPQPGKTFPSREAAPCVSEPITAGQPPAAQPGAMLLPSSLLAPALGKFTSNRLPGRAGSGTMRKEAFVQAPAVRRSHTGRFCCWKKVYTE